MEKFATAFAVPCTEEQYKAIAPKLKELGYAQAETWTQNSLFLVSDYGGTNGYFGGAISKYNLHMEKRLHLHAFNEELVLALAAMTTHPETHIKGEWLKNTSENLVKQGLNSIVGNFTKPTAQEIIAHFSVKPKFATGFAMECSKEQYQQIKPKLEGLGYSETTGVFGNHLVTNFYGQAEIFGHAMQNKNYQKLYLSTFNENLALALAAMTTDKDTVIPGEYCYNWRGDFIKRKDHGKAPCGKPTAQELIDHFTAPKSVEQQILETVAKGQSPSPEQLLNLWLEQNQDVPWSPKKVLEYFELEGIFTKLDQGWTLEMKPPAEVKLDNGVTIGRQTVSIDGKIYGLNVIKSHRNTLFDHSAYSAKFSVQLGDHNRRFEWQDLENIIGKHNEIYGTPSVAPGKSESIH